MVMKGGKEELEMRSTGTLSRGDSRFGFGRHEADEKGGLQMFTWKSIGERVMDGYVLLSCLGFTTW